MFGGRRTGTQHDLPSGLDAFALRTDGHLGSAVEIARDRTMLRFYRAFLAQSEIDFAIWSMRGSSVAHLKYRLGLLTSRFRANHPLKACIACMQDDLSMHGWVYWHQVHQFPGVWICPIHALPLRTSRLKSTGVERFLWHLPAESQLEAPWQDSDATQTLALQRLSMLTIALVGHNREDGYLHADSVQRTLRARFQERGWLTSGGYARLRKWQNSLTSSSKRPMQRVVGVTQPWLANWGWALMWSGSACWKWACQAWVPLYRLCYGMQSLVSLHKASHWIKPASFTTSIAWISSACSCRQPDPFGQL